MKSDWDKLCEEKSLEKFKKIYKVEKEEYLSRKKILSSRLGREAFDEDIIWMILNERVVTATFPNELSGIYCQMASELYKLNKDSFELQKLDFKHRLLSLAKAGIEKTSISSAEHLCPFFPKYHNKIYSVKDELKNQSFPKRSCTRTIEKYDDGSEEIKYEICHCLYLAYFEE